MKPILFNTEMVRAILDGRKTVTRRVVKPPVMNTIATPPLQPAGKPGFWAFYGEDGLRRAPYRPGDILYVRETFRIDYLSSIPGSGRVHYKADDTYADFRFVPERYEMMRRAQLKPGWRPNENMPKEAARLFLRVTDVRVERLQDISQADALREGANPAMAIMNFKGVWDSTIKKSDLSLYGWAANPWVWVIEFERIIKGDANVGNEG